MVSISGSKKLKRQMAPLFWRITRKDKRFVTTVRPGPHSKHFSIPSAVFLRDTLGIVSTMREAKASIYGGGVTVDGIQRRSLHHGIGLMDVVQLQNMSETYRLVPSGGMLLRPITIGDSERDRKLCRVSGKITIGGQRTQLNLHDGRSLITDVEAKVGDTILLQVPEQKILDVMPFTAGSQAMVLRGTNAGQIGVIKEIREGTFVLPKMATMELEDKTVQIPTRIIMVVGREAPAIQVK